MASEESLNRYTPLVDSAEIDGMMKSLVPRSMIWDHKVVAGKHLDHRYS